VINGGLENGNCIDKDAVGGVLATLHCQIVLSDPTGFDHIMRIHQSFVLRRRSKLDDDSGLDGSTRGGSWPLIVVSHHMILRDAVLRSDQPTGQR